MALIKLKSNLSSKGKTVDYFDNENQTGFTPDRQQGDSTEFNRPVNSLFSTKGKVVDYFNNENQKGFTPDRQQGDPTEFKQPAKSLFNDNIGGTNTTETGTFSVNQRDNTERKTQFTDNQVNAQHKKFKPDDDQLITHDIGDKYKGTSKDGGFVRGGFILNTDRQVEDAKRLTKFLSTPKGFLFKEKQSTLQKKNAREETRRYDRTSIIRNVDSVTEILNGDVSEAGEQRHLGGNYEETLKEGANFKDKENSKFINTVDQDGKRVDTLRDPGGIFGGQALGQMGEVSYNSSYQPEIEDKTKETITLNDGSVLTRVSSLLSNKYGPKRKSDNEKTPGKDESSIFLGQLTYEDTQDFFNLGGEENTKTGQVTNRTGWGGDKDRIDGIKKAVAYLTPSDAKLYKGASFGNDKVKPKSLQVLYGGEFGKMEELPTTTIKDNKAFLERKSSNDFIKFRIRDAVNGKWIIFPALITGITDNSQASYNKIQYIGRPDAVHVYQNFNRSISFNLKVLATNESELGIVWQKVSALKGLTQPSFKPFFYDNKKIKSTGEKFTRPTAPYVYLTIGDMFKNTPGYFESVNVTIPEAASWEIIEGAQFPHMCDISCTFQYIGRELPATTSINYDGLKPGISGQNPVIRDTIPIGEFEGAI